MEETSGLKERGRKFPPWKVKKKGIRPKEISYFDLGERESKYGQERREKKGRRRRRRRRRSQVWNLSIGMEFEYWYGI